MHAKSFNKTIGWESLTLLPAIIWLMLYGPTNTLRTPYPALPINLTSTAPQSWIAFSIYLVLLGVLYLLVHGIIHGRTCREKWFVLLITFTNPLFIQTSLSLASLGLITAYVFFLTRLAKLNKQPVAKAMPILGIALAALFFASPYAIFLLPPIVSSLIFFISPSLLQKAPGYIFMVLLLPLGMSILSTAYWFSLHDMDTWQFLRFTTNHTPPIDQSVWSVHYQRTIVTSFAMGLIWSSILCLRALVNLHKTPVYLQKLLACAIFAPALAMALASYYQPSLPPLTFFACLLFANILHHSPTTQTSTLYTLLASWTAGALLISVNN